MEYIIRQSCRVQTQLINREIMILRYIDYLLRIIIYTIGIRTLEKHRNLETQNQADEECKSVGGVILGVKH